MVYKSNRHVVYSCKYHVVFCLKYPGKFLVNGVDKRLKEIISQVTKEMSCEIDPQLGVHTLVKRVEGLSSRLLRQEFPHLKSRLPTLWTHSYFVSSVGGAPLAILKQYIENQKSV